MGELVAERLNYELKKEIAACEQDQTVAKEIELFKNVNGFINIFLFNK